MLFFLNQQNKRQVELFQGDSALDWNEHKAVWAEPFFNIRFNKMNKRVIHISPRRGKDARITPAFQT